MTMNTLFPIYKFLKENKIEGDPHAMQPEVAGGRILVGVSGGADSVSLLLTLNELRDEYSLAPIACHINHQLRGKESDEDARFVGDLCSNLKISCVIVDCDVKALAEKRGNGIEEAARYIRYKTFEKEADIHECDYVAVAHTADDQAETILFRIIRGTGVKGLAGMPAIRWLNDDVKLIRPMLNCTREEVLSYLESKGQSFRTDSSNDSMDYARNRIRKELLPLLSNYNVQVKSALTNLGNQAEDVRDFIDKEVSKVLHRMFDKKLDQYKDGSYRLPTGPIMAQHPYLAKEVLIKFWQGVEWEIGKLTCEHWQKMYHLFRDGGSATFPGNVQVTRRNSDIVTFQKMT